MPTEAPDLAVFLFAHQDDEFGVFEQIHLERIAGRELRVVYFTTGVQAGDSSSARDAESLKVLGGFGLSASQVLFAGRALDIADGALAQHLEQAASWLVLQLTGRRVAAIYAPAWEGGHPDHDSLCAVATAVCTQAGLLPALRHFALYNGCGCPGPLFRVLAPLPDNGPVALSRIPWSRRLRYLGACMRYPSQWRSWVGLLPFVTWHYLVDGRQALQRANPQRIGQRPHNGPLYYEKRGFSTWDAMHRQVGRFLQVRAGSAGS